MNIVCQGGDAAENYKTGEMKDGNGGTLTSNAAEVGSVKGKNVCNEPLVLTATVESRSDRKNSSQGDWLSAEGKKTSSR